MSNIKQIEVRGITYDVNDANAQPSAPGKGLSTNDYTNEDKALVDALPTAIGGIQQTIQQIDGLIPAQATPQNQLADKAFVNSSIGTATATFRGTFNLITDLSLTTSATREQIAATLLTAVSTADNNDYVFVQIPAADADPTVVSRIDRYKFNGTSWAYEWSLNNSSFTASQWAAINSGITSADVSKLGALPTNTELQAALASKYQKPVTGIPASDLAEGVIPDVSGFYSKPSTGIPKTDLAGGVQTSLGKADTAVQPSDLTPITEVIPSAASSSNQLADKAFVNSSISTATATFRGSFNLISDLSLTTAATQSQIATALGTAISTADNNDYAYVQIPTSDATPTEIARVERYKYNGSAWAFEYALNNSGFTAAQWAAINSGITSGLVSKLSDLPTNSELTNLLAGKQPTIDSSHKLSVSLLDGVDNAPTQNSDNLVKSGGVYTAVAAKYTKPANGIPASDIEAGVIPAAVEANPTVPSGTTPTDLAGLKVGNGYYGIPQLPTVDNAPTANSNNLVKSGGVYDAVNPSVQSSQPQGGFLPNVVYDLGVLTGTVTFALASGVTGKVNAYHWTFDTGSTAPTVNWPSNIIWPDGFTPTVDASMHYEVLVRNGYASMLSYSLS